MKTFVALLAAVPLVAFAQAAEPAPAPESAPPPQYTPPPQYAPPPEYAPPPTYAPPPQAAPPAQPPPPRAFPRREKQRGSWYIGFGLGGGDGTLKLADGSYSFEEYVGPDPTQLFLNIKVGATLTPKLLLGFDITAIRSAWEDDSGASAAAQVTNYDAVATFFPTGRGFFLRGGVGASAFVVDLDLPGYASGSESTTGVNVLGGVGYALWLGKAFNLTLNLDMSAQSYGDQDDLYGLLPESSSFWSLYVGCDWY